VIEENEERDLSWLDKAWEWVCQVEDWLQKETRSFGGLIGKKIEENLDKKIDDGRKITQRNFEKREIPN